MGKIFLYNIAQEKNELVFPLISIASDCNSFNHGRSSHLCILGMYTLMNVDNLLVAHNINEKLSFVYDIKKINSHIPLGSPQPISLASKRGTMFDPIQTENQTMKQEEKKDDLSSIPELVLPQTNGNQNSPQHLDICTKFSSEPKFTIILRYSADKILRLQLHCGCRSKSGFLLHF